MFLRTICKFAFYCRTSKKQFCFSCCTCRHAFHSAFEIKILFSCLFCTVYVQLSPVLLMWINAKQRKNSPKILLHFRVCLRDSQKLNLACTFNQITRAVFNIFFCNCRHSHHQIRIVFVQYRLPMH